VILSGAQPFLKLGDKRGVLLIHGFTGVTAEMLPLGEFLRGLGYTVLAVRLPGHGTTPEDLAAKTRKDWLDAVDDGLAILGDCVEEIAVIGHSMGGLCALSAALDARVTKVVTLAAPIYIHPLRGIDELPPRNACADLYIPKMRRRLPDVEPIVNKNYNKMPLLGVHEILALIEEVKDLLPKIVKPILIVHGRNDHTADTRSVEYICEHIASRRKEIFLPEDMGHLLPILPGREIIFSRIEKFLSDKSV